MVDISKHWGIGRWPPCCTRHFQLQFCERKHFVVYLKFHWRLFMCAIGNVSPECRQAITGSDVEQISWHHMASPGHNDFRKCHDCYKLDISYDKYISVPAAANSRFRQYTTSFVMLVEAITYILLHCYAHGQHYDCLSLIWGSKAWRYLQK